MLKDVFSGYYANKVDDHEAYKNADKCFCDLLKKYELYNEKYLNKFKLNSECNEYNFNEKHIQLLKLIKEIDDNNPVDRSNVSSKNLTLDRFNKVADIVKNAINDEKYPDITEDIKSTLRTPEFLSLYFLHNLVKKITLLFQYVCQNNYSDFEIYNQVNEYLDTLLYSYTGHEHYSDFMNEVYYKPLEIKMPHGSDNKVEFNDISIYRGIKKYVQKVFDAVTTGDGKSNSIEADLIQGEYRYVFEFDSIEKIADFICEYCKYFDISYKFKNYCNHNLIYRETILDEEISCKYIEEAFSTCLCNKIMNKINIDKKEKQSQINYIKERIESDICILHLYTKFDGGVREKFKTQCKNLRNAQKCFISKCMYTYGNGNFLRINDFISTIQNEVFAKIKNLTNDFEFEIVEALFYDGFILPTYNLSFALDAVRFQLSYKSFKIQLPNIDAIKEHNKQISNKEIVDGISNVLKKIDNQITDDFENDNELYSAISNAVGNYLYKIFEQSEANKSKKKSK